TCLAARSFFQRNPERSEGSTKAPRGIRRALRPPNHPPGAFVDASLRSAWLEKGSTKAPRGIRRALRPPNHPPGALVDASLRSAWGSKSLRCVYESRHGSRLLRFQAREEQPERRALAELRLDLDPPSVRRQDLLHEREAEAGAAPRLRIAEL